MNKRSQISAAVAGFGAVVILAVWFSPPGGVDSFLRGDTYEPSAYALYIGVAYLLLGGATRIFHQLSFKRALIIATVSGIVLYIMATVVQYVDVFVYEPVPDARFVPVQLLVARLDFVLSLLPIVMALPLGVAIVTEDDRGVLVAGSMALGSYVLAVAVFLSDASGFFLLLLGLFVLLGVVEVLVSIPVYLIGKAAARSD